MHNPLQNLSFHSLFEASAEALVLADGEGRILHSNPAAQSLFGYEEHEWLGQPVEMLVPPALRDHHRRYRESYEDGETLRERLFGAGRARLTNEHVAARYRDPANLRVPVSPLRFGPPPAVAAAE